MSRFHSHYTQSYYIEHAFLTVATVVPTQTVDYMIVGMAAPVRQAQCSQRCQNKSPDSDG